MFRRKHETIQNLIVRPGNIDIYSAGRRDKPLPKTLLVHSTLPVGAHQRKMKLLSAEQVEDHRFRKHPESSLPERGKLCPEQLREPTEIGRAASLARLRSEACSDFQGHTIHGFQGGGVDPLKKAGSLENAVKSLKCHGSVQIRFFGISGSRIHSFCLKR